MIQDPSRDKSNEKSPHILIVEDEAIVALDIRARLSALGYTVTGVAPSSEKAIQLALEKVPDIILMDIMLEGNVDGIDTAAEIRKHHSIPVIYLTAYADAQTLKRAKITDPFGYIIKPFEDRELNLTIEMALYKHKAETVLEDNRRWLKTTFNSIGDAVITTDQNNCIKSINKMASIMTGCSIESVFGHKFEDQIKLLAPSSFKPLNLFEEKSSATIIDDAVLKTPSKITPVSINVSSIMDKQHVLGTVVVLRDISQLKQSETALRNSLKQLHRTFDETVVSLTAMSEKRDPYTSGHQQRVAQLACAIARKMGIEKEKIHSIHVAGILHDIGKISIPAEILSKPTRLTDLEMTLMKTHSEAGYEILKGISFPWPVAKIVLQHHERMDGSGYPKGLTGENILQEARIIAVADVVEAMSSHRPYRAALGLSRAMGEIIRGRGTIYDSDVVDASTQVIENDNFSFDSERT